MTGPDRCPTTLVWDDRFLEYDFGPEHPFTERSRALAVELIEAASETTPGRIRELAPATRTELARFHHGPYLDRVERVSASSRKSLLDTGDTPGFPGCFTAAARLCAGTLAGLDLVLRTPGQHAFQPGGGLHHARPDAASGFCIFNDVAVAIATALGERRLRRVAYIDIDAHHGDGVMYGFYRDGRVLDIDFHQDGRTLFPGTGSVSEVGSGDGAGSKVNLPLPPGAGDSALLLAFRRVVPPLLREFRPEILLLQNGVDGHAGDPLASLQYGPAAYGEVVSTLHGLAHELCGGRLLVTGGGGYRAESVSRVLAQTGLLISGTPAPAPETPLPEPWRQKFESLARHEAPRTWGEREAHEEEASSVEATRAMLAELERHLGQRLSSEGA